MSKELNKEVVANIKAGLDQPFWQTLSQIIKENIDLMGGMILGDIDKDENGLPFTLTDEDKREKEKSRLQWKKFLDLPKQILESEEKGVTYKISNDPYFQLEDIKLNESVK
mgnify:CR=1 FL=1